MAEDKGTKLPGSGATMVFSRIRWTMLFNMLQRVITFVLNQSMIAWTSPEIFGIAAISLELLLSTLLFLSREGVRLACLRETIVTSHQRQLIVNVRNIFSIILSSEQFLMERAPYKISCYYTDIVDSKHHRCHNDTLDTRISVGNKDLIFIFERSQL